MTRGERNNNPGNIDYTPSIPYLGQLGAEIVPASEGYAPRFARFDTAEHGIRALCVCLLAYYRRHGLDTVAGIIGRWAPGNENDTGAYIAAVSKDMGVGPNQVILLSDGETLGKLATAVIRHENGAVPYDAETIATAAEQALAGTTLPTPPRQATALPAGVPASPAVAALRGGPGATGAVSGGNASWLERFFGWL